MPPQRGSRPPGNKGPQRTTDSPYHSRRQSSRCRKLTEKAQESQEHPYVEMDLDTHDPATQHTPPELEVQECPKGQESRPQQPHTTSTTSISPTPLASYNSEH